MRFADISGHQQIKDQLINSVKEGRVSHALLFLGKPGFGTLPLALALVQYLSCQDKQENDSCGECASCRKMQKLQHPDLHFSYPVISLKSGDKPVSDDFIKFWQSFVEKTPYGDYNLWLNSLNADNAQGSIRVQESAAILRKLNLKSFESEYKFMLIWMAEKMNVETANKLLKILEEPPSKTVFILMAESTEHMLNTILSRTQMLKVPRLKDNDIVSILGEKLGLNAEEAMLISRMSEGDLNMAMQFAEASADSEKNFELFTQLMRLSYGAKFLELVPWVDGVAKLGREKIKSFFVYSLRLVRENLMMNQKQSQLARMSGKEKEFSARFSAFIHYRNTPMLLEELNKAHLHISRNANAKVVLMDLCIKVSQILKVPVEQ